MSNNIKLQPGLLVGLSTKISGGVHYSTRDLNADEIPVEGDRRSRNGRPRRSPMTQKSMRARSGQAKRDR